MRRRVGWVVGGLVVVGLVGGWLWWWLRPPQIELPPRRYPAKNAYEAYKMLAQQMEHDLKRDPRTYAHFLEIERALFTRTSPVQVSEAEKHYFLKRMRPYLEAYRAFLHLPSMVVYEYDPRWLFPEVVQFRRIVRAESLLIHDALRQGREQEAVARARTVARFAEQVRNEGTLILYFTGDALLLMAIDPLRTYLPRMRDPRALEAIVQLAREYEQQRTPLAEAFQHEYYFGLSFYRALATGQLRLDEYLQMYDEANRHRSSLDGILAQMGVPVVTRPALREYQRYHNQLQQELAKPMWERQPNRLLAKRYLNTVILQPWEPAFRKEQHEVAVMRLLGCAAATRLHKLRTGRYPESLQALNLGELTTDPFTGKLFIYRVQGQHGFQLYSVGANGTDDGGRLAYNEASEGDLLPITVQALPESLRPQPPHTPLTAPLWLR